MGAGTRGANVSDLTELLGGKAQTSPQAVATHGSVGADRQGAVSVEEGWGHQGGFTRRVAQE